MLDLKVVLQDENPMLQSHLNTIISQRFGADRHRCLGNQSLHLHRADLQLRVVH
jgi:hypothetical protein